ncbi:Asp-tRNA(Asn)/Glu-tRNA(Gln) amidotransferase GatCAB subunit B, partial [Candidatus Bathyarchaeota archaeon]
TVTLRTKEEEQDYRYFPEPDLVPIELDENFINNIKARMPELPEARAKRFIKSYGLPRYDAEVLVSSKALADFFEECVKLYDKPKVISNWMMSDMLRYLYENNLELEESKITPKKLVDMIRLIDEGVISGKIAKRILPEIIVAGKDPMEIVRSRGLVKITDRRLLSEIIDKVFRENSKAVDDALKNEKAVHFLVGQLMRETGGKADPAIANEMIRERLRSLRRKLGV